MDINEALKTAEECGFSHFGPLDPGKLEFLQDVRDMCAADKCQRYGKSWACPPGCGTLEECAERASRFNSGILVQSTGDMEDEFDIETIMGTAKLHGEKFRLLIPRLRAIYGELLPMGAGGCQLCEKCAYPEPCRFPDAVSASMEACGLFVSKVCRDNGLEYYYGKNTLTYTSCCLFNV